MVEDEPNDEPTTKESGVSHTLSKAGQWLRDHLMVACVVILLVGGIVALAIYFACEILVLALQSYENAYFPSPVYYNKNDQADAQTAICVSPACVLAASNIINNLSPNYRNLDPCTEFDKYVCEGFDEKHDLRPDQSSIFTPTIMAEHGQQILRHVLESPYPVDEGVFEAHSSAKKEIFDKLQSAYDSCMDEGRIKAAGSGPLLAVLKQIEDHFPAAKPQSLFENGPGFPKEAQKSLSSERRHQLPETVSYLNSIGVTAIISLGVGADDKDPDTVVVSVNAPRQPGLPSKQYYKDPLTVAKYGQVIGQVLEGLLDEARRPDVTTQPQLLEMTIARSAKLVEQIVALESKFAKLTPDTEDAEDVMFYYNPMTPEEADALNPNLSISSIVSSLTPPGCKPSKYIIGAPSYLEGVSHILKSTSAEALQAYFVWKTVQTHAYKVEDDVLKPLKSFNNELQGKGPDAAEERWRTCIRVVDNGLGWILSKFFVEKAFSKESKEFGDHIILDIKAQFIKKLGAAEWMSKDVQNLSIEKVHNIVQKIGYPTKSPNIRDSSDIKSYYDSLNITKHAYFSNAISVATFDTNREWSALCKPTDRDEWGMTADTVNAYYNPAGNEIVFPAGIMQAPVFYDPSLPQYMSYGAFGAVSGHELSHAFDSSGRHYDENGNFTDWWDDETVEAFQEKVQCFIDQYDNFTVPNPKGELLHVNGKLTLGENLADAGGLSASFLAWKAVDATDPAELLPGLQDFTKEQVFFMSYANFWCGKTRPETAVSLIYRDPHAPTRARILVS